MAILWMLMQGILCSFIVFVYTGYIFCVHLLCLFIQGSLCSFIVQGTLCSSIVFVYTGYFVLIYCVY